MRIPLLLLLLVAVSGCDRMDWAPVAPLVKGYQICGTSSEGRALVRASKSRRLGYIDETGLVVIPARFESADHFSEGLAPVRGEYTDGYQYINAKAGRRIRYGYIDRAGKPVIAHAFFSAQSFHQGLAFVIEPQFVNAEAFSDGLALVQDVVGRRGYTDKSGQWAVPPSFLEEAQPFAEGLALVKLNGRYGFVDKTGRFAIPPRCFRAESSSQGLPVTAVEGNRCGSGACVRETAELRRARQPIRTNPLWTRVRLPAPL